MPQHEDILIFSGKYATQYFDVSTPSKRAAAFLHLLRQNREAGWFYEPDAPDVSEQQRAYAAMTDEQVNNLPDELVADMIVKRSRAQREVQAAETDHGLELDWWLTLNELLALPQAAALAQVGRYGYSTAEHLMRAHRDREYEGYEFERFTPTDS